MILQRDSWGTLLTTLALAALLTLIPLPPWAEFLRPYWVALVIIYWGLETQGLVTLGGAFFIGLAMDFITGSLLGQHALSLIILVYLVDRFRARIRFFPAMQQALSVFGLLVNDRIILLWVVLAKGEPLPPLAFWLAPVVGMICWPWVFLALDRFRGRMKHRSA
jgi:rod shape-determining protein MreD